jgi:hypothetical protein
VALGFGRLSSHPEAERRGGRANFCFSSRLCSLNDTVAIPVRFFWFSFSYAGLGLIRNAATSVGVIL